MSRYFVFAVLLLTLASPAAAAEYYLAKDPTTQNCEIVSEKPDGTSSVMVGTEAYATKEEAKAARKAARDSGECKKKERKEDAGN